MQIFKVEYYKTQDGNCPTEEFMNSLDEKMKAKLLRLQYCKSFIFFYVWTENDYNKWVYKEDAKNA